MCSSDLQKVHASAAASASVPSFTFVNIKLASSSSVARLTPTNCLGLLRIVIFRIFQNEEQICNLCCQQSALPAPLRIPRENGKHRCHQDCLYTIFLFHIERQRFRPRSCNEIDYSECFQSPLKARRRRLPNLLQNIHHYSNKAMMSMDLGQSHS